MKKIAVLGRIAVVGGLAIVGRIAVVGRPYNTKKIRSDRRTL
jgi:hypothetical protein